MDNPSAAKALFDLQGHRGARGLRPENTLPAFTCALSLGVSTLELDTAVTRDGVVIVTHDSRPNPDIARDDGVWLQNPGRPFFSMSFDDVQRFDVGRTRPSSAYAARFPDQVAIDGTRIPKLGDVFALAAKAGNVTVRFNIETKIDPRAPGDTPAPETFATLLIKEIRAAGVERRATIQSFDWRTLRVVRSVAPEIETVCLTTQQEGEDTIRIGQPGSSPWLDGLDAKKFGGSVPDLVKAAGGAVWSPNYLDLTADVLEEAHRLGLSVIPWTANDPAEMARLIDMGIDGLISDRPDLLRGVLANKDRPLPAPASIAI